MRGEFCLAKTRSSTLGILAAQTIEYKGFGDEKARKMARQGGPELDKELNPGARNFRNSLQLND